MLYLCSFYTSKQVGKLEERCLDNGIYVLSVCKYIVDNVPNLYSINYESKGMIDTYYKQEIIDAYNKIKNNQK